MGYDLIIRNGAVVDGSGAPAYRADVALSGGRIAAVGRLRGERGRILKDQDHTLDVARRRQMLLQMQEIILGEYYGAMVPAIHRVVLQGHMPWVRNYYASIPLSYSPRFRWEQVWLER